MTDSISKKPLRKGSLVFLDKEIYIKSIEALARIMIYLIMFLKVQEKFLLLKMNMLKLDGVDLFQTFG